MIEDAGTGRDTLDATPTVQETTVSDTHVAVNGPEDHPVDWDTVRRHQTDLEVRRLRQRIFNGDDPL